MNHIVRSWNRYQGRSKYEGPDAIEVDGQKIIIEENKNMAVRKKPHVEPVMDNDVVNKDKKAERSLIVHELSKPDFNSLISYILKSPFDRVQIIRTATWETLKRLKIKRDKSKAVTKIPKNVSTEGNAGSIVVWLSKIEPTHKKSIRQLVVIDATVVARG